MILKNYQADRTWVKTSFQLAVVVAAVVVVVVEVVAAVAVVVQVVVAAVVVVVVVQVVGPQDKNIMKHLSKNNKGPENAKAATTTLS